MATPDAYAGTVNRPADAPAPTTVAGDDRNMLERMRARSAERKRRRLVGARSRRIHAQWLRRTADRATDRDPIRRRREALLHYRAAAVRTDLLELAAMLERAHEPDPACMAELHELLANGCDSPLYNANIPVDELHTTIERLRTALINQPRLHSAPNGSQRGHAMSVEDTLAYGTHFPGPSPRISTVARRLKRLGHWRIRGSAIAIAAAGLLPFAVAWHPSYLVAMAATFGAAATVAICCHVAREFQLARLAIHPEFAHLPDLARKHRQLDSPRNRRRLAQGLRRTALATGKPNRFDACPLLQDRVASARPAILEIAAILEHDCTADPICLALLGELLHDGCSPLYNPNLHATDVDTILKRVRTGLTPGPAALKKSNTRAPSPGATANIPITIK